MIVEVARGNHLIPATYSTISQFVGTSMGWVGTGLCPSSQVQEDQKTKPFSAMIAEILERGTHDVSVQLKTA